MVSTAISNAGIQHLETDVNIHVTANKASVIINMDVCQVKYIIDYINISTIIRNNLSSVNLLCYAICMHKGDHRNISMKSTLNQQQSISPSIGSNEGCKINIFRSLYLSIFRSSCIVHMHTFVLFFP